MIVESGVEVIMQLHTRLYLIEWMHLFGTKAKVLRVFRQPLVVRIQRAIDDDFVWIPAGCVLAWCRSRSF